MTFVWFFSKCLAVRLSWRCPPGVGQREQNTVKSRLTKLQRVSDRALQKHSDRVRATPGQQCSGTGQNRSQSKQLGLPNTKLCTYILDIVSGNGLVATIDRPFGYNYDIQPFHPRSVLQGVGGGEKTWQKNWDFGCEVVFAEAWQARRWRIPSESKGCFCTWE